jgi:hypothetical protein
LAKEILESVKTRAKHKIEELKQQEAKLNFQINNSIDKRRLPARTLQTARKDQRGGKLGAPVDEDWKGDERMVELSQWMMSSWETEGTFLSLVGRSLADSSLQTIIVSWTRGRTVYSDSYIARLVVADYAIE